MLQPLDELPIGLERAAATERVAMRFGELDRFVLIDPEADRAFQHGPRCDIRAQYRALAVLRRDANGAARRRTLTAGGGADEAARLRQADFGPGLIGQLRRARVSRFAAASERKKRGERPKQKSQIAHGRLLRDETATYRTIAAFSRCRCGRDNPPCCTACDRRRAAPAPSCRGPSAARSSIRAGAATAPGPRCRQGFSRASARSGSCS